MANDDYPVLVCKILVFLYKKLKGKTNILTENYIQPLTSDFPVSEDYFSYVIEHLVKDEYVEKVKIVDAWGGKKIILNISEMQITPKGIDYLMNNSIMKKIVNTLEEAKPIISLFF